MQRRPKASFIIPVYNGELYIAETIDSCLLQTEKNFEVVIVDDGSRDSTPDILAWFTMHDHRVKVTTFAENRGRSAARNAAIINAAGDVLLMLDADDLSHPERLRTTLKHFKKHPTNDIVYGKYQLIDSLGSKGPIIHEAGEPFNWPRVLETKLTYIGHSTMAFQSRVFDTIHYTEGDWSRLGIDDWKLQIDAYKAKFIFGAIPHILTYYRYKAKSRDEKQIQDLKNQELDQLVTV